MSFLCVNPLPFALSAGVGVGNEVARATTDEILSARASLLAEYYNTNFSHDGADASPALLTDVAHAVLRFAAGLPRGQLGAVSKTAAAVNTVFPGRASADPAASAASALSPRRIGGGTVALDAPTPGSPAATSGEHGAGASSDAARLQRSTALALASADAAAQRDFVIANISSLLARFVGQDASRVRVAVALRLLLLVGFSLPPAPHALRGPAPSSAAASAAPSRLPSARSAGGTYGGWREGRRGSTGSASSDEVEEGKDGSGTPADGAEGVVGPGSRRLSFGTAAAASTQLSAAAAALLQTPVLLSDLLGPADDAGFGADAVGSTAAAVRDRLAASPPFPATLAAAALGAGVGFSTGSGSSAAALSLSHSGSLATLLAQGQALGPGLSLSRAFPMEAAVSSAAHHATSATAATPSSAGANVPLSAAGLGMAGFASIASPGMGGGMASGSAAPRSPAAAASLSKSHSAFSISLRGAADSMGGGGGGPAAAAPASSAALAGLLTRTMSNPYASASSPSSAAIICVAAFRGLCDVDDGIGWSASDTDEAEPGVAVPVPTPAGSSSELTDHTASGSGSGSASLSAGVSVPPLQLHLLVSGAARSTVLLPASSLSQLLTCLPSKLLRRYPGMERVVDAAVLASATALRDGDAAAADLALRRLQSSLQVHLRIEDVSDASVYAPLPAVATAIVRAVTRSCVAAAPCRLFAGVDFAEASTLALAAAAVTVRNALDVCLQLRVRGPAVAAAGARGLPSATAVPSVPAVPAVLAHGELRALRLAPYGACYSGLALQAHAAGVLPPVESLPGSVAATPVSVVSASSSALGAEGKDGSSDGKADAASASDDPSAAFCRVAVAGSPSVVSRVLQSAGARNVATGLVSPATLVRAPPGQDASDGSDAMALAVLDVMRASAAHVADASDAAPPIALLPPASFVPFSCVVPRRHDAAAVTQMRNISDGLDVDAGLEESLPLPSAYEKALAERRHRANALHESMSGDSTAATDTSSRMLQLAVQAAFTVSERIPTGPPLESSHGLQLHPCRLLRLAPRFTFAHCFVPLPYLFRCLQDWIAERCANDPALRAYERLRSANKLAGASAIRFAEAKDNV